MFGAGGGQALADKIGVPLLGQVPLEDAVRAGGDDGRPVMITDPSSPAAAAFSAIAQRLPRLGNATPTQRMSKRLTVL